MELKIEKHENGQEIVVKVAGEIDVYTAPKLREEVMPLTEEKHTTIVVDLTQVTYLDSTGLGVFVGMFKQLKEHEGELLLTGLSERLQRLFKITGLSNIMNISNDGGR